MPNQGVDVYEVDSGLGGYFTVSIVQKLEDGTVEVRIWQGESTISGWKSYGLFDGKIFRTRQSNLHKCRRLS